MLPPEVPRLATDLLVRVFLGVWKPLFFKYLPGTELPPHLLCLLSRLLYFFLPVFENNGLLFWLPDVLCQPTEVVLWSLLGIEMFFWGICEGESGLPILFLHHLFNPHQYLNKCFCKQLIKTTSEVAGPINKTEMKLRSSCAHFSYYQRRGGTVKMAEE